MIHEYLSEYSCKNAGLVNAYDLGKIFSDFSWDKMHYFNMHIELYYLSNRAHMFVWQCARDTYLPLDAIIRVIILFLIGKGQDHITIMIA